MSDFDSLDQKIRALESQHKGDGKDAIRDRNKRQGMQAGVELIGAIAAGTLIGIGLDHLLGTKPLFSILMFLLGVFTGFYNVYRVTQNMGSAVGFAQNKKVEDKELHPDQKDAKTLPDSKKD